MMVPASIQRYLRFVFVMRVVLSNVVQARRPETDASKVPVRDFPQVPYAVLSEDPDDEPEMMEYTPTNFSRGDTTPDESRLVDHLMKGYSKYGTIARPVMDSSRQMSIEFGLRLIKMSVSEKDQTMTTSVWIRSRWVDEYLRWDPRDFGNISLTVMPYRQVWIPDVALVNTAETDIYMRQADVMVDCRGRVFWSPHRVYTSACLVDVTNFPFDTHTCDLWFQAMSRYSMQMDLKPYFRSPWNLDTYISSYKDSQEWAILQNTSARIASSRDVGITLKFSNRVSLRYSLTITRRHGYTTLLLMVPCVFLGSTTLVIFWLPPDRPDRITLAMSLLASFLVLMLILVEAAPPTAASIPLLGIYYACVMILIMLSPFLSAIVVHISRRGNETKKRPPPWIRKVMLEWMTWPLCLRGRVREIDDLLVEAKHTAANIQEKPEISDASRPAVIYEDSENESDVEYATEATPTSNPSGPHLNQTTTPSTGNGVNRRRGSTGSGFNAIQRRFSQIERTVDKIQANNLLHKYRRLYDPVYLEWRLIAHVIDRTCFFLYLVALILSHIFFYPRPR